MDGRKIKQLVDENVDVPAYQLVILAAEAQREQDAQIADDLGFHDVAQAIRALA